MTVDDILEKDNCIPAIVPGNLEIDLQRAGLLEDPFYGQNVLKAQELEAVHMFYGRKFKYSKTERTVPILTFEGLDTVAEIYLNGKLIGSCENMFVAQTFQLDTIKDGENDLLVHIIPACIAARGRKLSVYNSALKYNYESLRLRKSASMFGWDIMPRLVSGGIYRPVYIEDRPLEYLKQVYVMAKYVDPNINLAEIEMFFDAEVLGDAISEYEITLRGHCRDSSFEISDRLWFSAGHIRVWVENALLWWPKGYGAQALYDVEVTLSKNDVVIDTWMTRFGIRSVALERTAITDQFLSGKFQFYVNNKKIFILGTNMVPIDALHSRDRQRLPRVMELVEDTGCNMIRLWGGGIYEDDYLYDFCDEKGILIWQDFCMACGTYPVDDDFCEVMREEGEKVVRRLRQHPAIAIWAGDNECDVMGFKGKPSNNKITREVLQKVVEFEDSMRPYLPSSPFVDLEAEKYPGDLLPENHLWGPRDYYKSEYYKRSLCSFVSEIGYHGCPSRSSLGKFLPADKLWPWKGNDDWMLHASSMEKGERGIFAYRIELMAKQIKELFGEIPDTLDDFILASQISQAEAKKFFIEFFRTGQPKRTGIIWWNLIDGWPQFSDAVVDYYFEKKLAYHYIKQVQQPVLLSIKEPENWNLVLVAVNDTDQSLALKYCIKEMTAGEVIIDEETTIHHGVTPLKNIPYSQGEKKMYLMEWEVNGCKGKNHYLAGNPPFSLEVYRRLLKDLY